MIVARICKIGFNVDGDNQTHNYATNGLRINEAEQKCTSLDSMLGLHNQKSVIANDTDEAATLLAANVHQLANSFCGSSYRPQDFHFTIKYSQVDPETKEFWPTPSSYGDHYCLEDFPKKSE